MLFEGGSGSPILRWLGARTVLTFVKKFEAFSNSETMPNDFGLRLQESSQTKKQTIIIEQDYNDNKDDGDYDDDDVDDDVGLFSPPTSSTRRAARVDDVGPF